MPWLLVNPVFYLPGPGKVPEEVSGLYKAVDDKARYNKQEGHKETIEANIGSLNLRT